MLNAEAQERLFAHLLRRYGRTRKAPATVQEIQKDFLAPAPICNEERVADTVCLSRWAILDGCRATLEGNGHCKYGVLLTNSKPGVVATHPGAVDRKAVVLKQAAVL